MQPQACVAYPCRGGTRLRWRELEARFLMGYAVVEVRGSWPYSEGWHMTCPWWPASGTSETRLNRCVGDSHDAFQHRSTKLRIRIVVSLGPYGSYGKLHLPRVTTELN